MFSIKLIISLWNSRLRYGVLLLLIIGTTLNCGLYIGENILPTQQPGLSVGCLNGMQKKFVLYLKGQLEAEEIHQVANCAKMVLNIFKERVRGVKRNEFTPQELRKFIQDVFLQDQVIRDAFLVQIMRLKQVIIGGPEDKLVASDIDLFITFIDVIQKEAVFIQPYIQTFYQLYNHQPISDKNNLNSIAEQELQKSIDRISVFLKDFSQPYILSDMKEFIKEMYYFFDPKYEVSNLDHKIKALGVMKKFIIQGGSDLVIEPHEWEDLFLGSSYILFTNINVAILKKRNTDFFFEGMHNIFAIYNMLIKFLSLIVENNPKHVLTEKDFSVIISQLQETNIISSQLTAEAIKSVLLISVGKVFNLKKDNYGTIELNFAQIKAIKKMAKPWINVHLFLDKFFHKKQNSQKSLSLKQVESVFPKKKQTHSAEYNILKQLMSFKPLYRAHQIVHVSREIYSPKDIHKLYLYKNLTIYNFYYLLARLITLGYKRDDMYNLGITQEELGAFLVDFNSIQQYMDWIKKTTQTVSWAGEAEFIAGNILTPFTKGFTHNINQTEYLTPHEIVEYLSYAISVGFSVQKLEQELLKVCRSDERGLSYNSKLTPTEDYKYNIDCVRVHLLFILKKIMPNMPDMQYVLARSNAVQKKQWVEALINISFKEEAAYEKATFLVRENLTNIILAFYFVETTITRFDTNNDRTLDNSEIQKGFTVFRGYLSHMLTSVYCHKDDKLAVSVYAYSIHNQTLPEMHSWIKSTLVWIDLQLYTIFKQNYWDLSLNRMQLTNVYSSVIKGFFKTKEQQDLTSQCGI